MPRMAVDTLPQARAQYLANASYDAGAGSVTMAEAFVEACRAILVLTPAESRNAADSVRFDLATIRSQLKAAARFVRIRKSASGRVRYLVRNAT